MSDDKNVHDTFQRHAKLKVRCKIFHKPESISFSGTCDLLLLCTTSVLVITHSKFWNWFESLLRVFDFDKKWPCAAWARNVFGDFWCCVWWDGVRGIVCVVVADGSFDWEAREGVIYVCVYNAEVDDEWLLKPSAVVLRCCSLFII